MLKLSGTIMVDFLGKRVSKFYIYFLEAVKPENMYAKFEIFS